MLSELAPATSHSARHSIGVDQNMYKSVIFRVVVLLKACSKPGSFYDDGGGGEPTIFMAVILQICCVRPFIRIEQRTQESTES